MPAAADDDTVKVAVDVPAPVMEVGLNDTVTPVGCPLAVSAIAELNPPATVVVIVDVPLLPSATDTDVGEAEIAKLGEVDEDPVSAAISPVFGLPQPVTRS